LIQVIGPAIVADEIECEIPTHLTKLSFLGSPTLGACYRGHQEHLVWRFYYGEGAAMPVEPVRTFASPNMQREPAVCLQLVRVLKRQQARRVPCAPLVYDVGAHAIGLIPQGYEYEFAADVDRDSTCDQTMHEIEARRGMGRVDNEHTAKRRWICLAAVCPNLIELSEKPDLLGKIVHVQHEGQTGTSDIGPRRCVAIDTTNMDFECPQVHLG
jgi:hypothetical protein